MNITNPWLTPYQRSYHQIKQQLISGLTSIQKPGGGQLITDVSEGNILVIILSMFAAIAEVIHYYIDSKAREFFLSTARRYSSVQALGALVGYYPKAAVAATVDLVLTRGDKLSSGSNLSGTIADGYTFISNDMTWMVKGPVTIPAYTSQILVPVIQHREYTLSSIIGTNLVAGTRTLSISLGDLPSGEYYEHGSMRLVINSITYTLVETFAYSRPDDYHFTVEVAENGDLLIKFGDGTFGSSIGSTVLINNASCYLTKGSTGNVEAGSITTSIVSSNYGMSTSNPYPATGGSDYESIASMKERIPLQARTQGVAITKRDYEDLALMVPGVGKAKVEYNCGRLVSLYIYPSNASTNSNLQASNILKNTVKTKLTPYLPLSTILKVFSLGTSNIVLDINVTGRPNYKANDILTHIRTALYTAYNSNASDIGGTVRISDLYALLDNLPSIDYLQINKFYVRPYAIPLKGGRGFNPYSFVLNEASQSIEYIITMRSGGYYNIISKDGKYNPSGFIFNSQRVENIVDSVHNVSYGIRLFTSSDVSSDLGRVGNKYRITVSKVNSDYVDTGYTVPIFARDTDLTTSIVETI